MPAQRKISMRQTEILLNFMETHNDLSKGRVQGGPLGKQVNSVLWERLTKKLNSVEHGITKSTKEWKMYWNNVKYKVRAKVTQIHKNSSGEGVNFTNEEIRISAIIGEESMHRIDSVQMPFLDEARHTPSPKLKDDRKISLSIKNSLSDDEEELGDPLHALDNSPELIPLRVLNDDLQIERDAQSLTTQNNVLHITSAHAQEEHDLRIRILRLQARKERELIKQESLKTRQEKIKLEMLEMQIKKIKDRM